MDLTIVILAAGKGKRMKSLAPKVLNTIGGKPMILHVVKTAQSLSPKQIVMVHGEEKNQIQTIVAEPNVQWAAQAAPLGTGDAVAKAMPFVPKNHRVLILYGDVPLIEKETLQRLLHAVPEESIGLLTAKVHDPTGLGRIVRNTQRCVERIVEERDANDLERQIHEINTGIFVVPGHLLNRWLPQLENHNAQKEYYLTDLIQFAARDAVPIITAVPRVVEEVLGVNNTAQQVIAERFYQQNLAEKLLEDGVWICDPARFDLRGTLKAGKHVSLDVNIVLEGQIILGNGTRIGPNCVLKDCDIGENVTVFANSYFENVKIASNCVIGPFARLRPGTVLAKGAKVGNFVEVKNAKVGEGSKINHLSYIGDTLMGANVNVGAGTITCNYDGSKKHQTIIEDNVFIGSDTQLLAPVTVGQGATLGAGTTLHQDAPPDKLTISQTLKQRVVENWQRSEQDTKKDKGVT